MWRVKNLLFRLFDVRFWLQNQETDWEWDAELIRILDEGPEVKVVSSAVVKLAGREIWVSNYPYAYGNEDRVNYLLPSPLTRRRLRGYLAKAPNVGRLYR